MGPELVGADSTKSASRRAIARHGVEFSCFHRDHQIEQVIFGFY